MSNDYYSHGSYPATNATGTSAAMRAELDLVTAGFDKIAPVTANAGKAVVINGGGTAQTVTTGGLALAGDFSTVGAFSIALTATAGTAVTLPTSGTLATLAGSEAITNKTIDLAHNTLTGTIAQFNSACSDADFATIAGSESLSNKTLAGPTLSGTINGTYTLAGTPTITSPTISNPAFSGTSSGTYTLAGTIGITSPTITTGVVAADPVVALGIASKQYVDASVVPTGAILEYGGASAPSGYLLMNQDVSRTTYSALFAVVGTTYGAGDGSTTFGLHKEGVVSIGAGTGTRVEICTSSSSNGFVVTSNNTKWITGMPVVVSALSGFGGTISATSYYLVRVSATNIRFATTLALAQAGTPDITITGSGSATVTYTMTARTLGQVGGEEAHAQAKLEMYAHAHTQSAGNSGGLSGIPTTAASITGTLSNIDAAGGNAAMNIMQSFVVSNFIIKT